MKIEYCCECMGEAVEEEFIFFDKSGAHIGRKNDMTMCIEYCPFCGFHISVTTLEKNIDE